MKICRVSVGSAGGTGVLLNVDRVSELLGELGYAAIQVRGLSDSGWFLDNKQYHCTDCVDTTSCTPTDTIKRGIKYGNKNNQLKAQHFLNNTKSFTARVLSCFCLSLCWLKLINCDDHIEFN